MRCLLLASLLLALAATVPACGQGSPATATQPAATSATTSAAPAPETLPALTVADLPGLAASLDDLPDGFSVSAEGAIGGDQAVLGGYRRAFDPGTALLGTSRVADVTSTETLFATPVAAEVALAAILDGLTGDQVEQQFARLVLANTGIEATSIAGRTLVSGLAQASVAAEASFDTAAGRVAAVYVVALVGPTHSSVFLVGPEGGVHLDDAVKLLKLVLPRVEERVTGTLAA